MDFNVFGVRGNREMMRITLGKCGKCGKFLRFGQFRTFDQDRPFTKQLRVVDVRVVEHAIGHRSVDGKPLEPP